MSRTAKYTTIPSHLKHKPIYVMEGYSPIDGCYKNDTDVIGFSVGNAQWTENGDFVPSIKVWRDVKVTVDGKEHYRISRQSEETTLTRALDMALFVVRVADANLNGAGLEGISTVHGQVKIKRANDTSGFDNDLRQYMQDEKNDVKSHIRDLKDAIDAFYRHVK